MQFSVFAREYGDHRVRRPVGLGMDGRRSQAVCVALQANCLHSGQYTTHWQFVNHRFTSLIHDTSVGLHSADC